MSYRAAGNPGRGQEFQYHVAFSVSENTLMSFSASPMTGNWLQNPPNWAAVWMLKDSSDLKDMSPRLTIGNTRFNVLVKLLKHLSRPRGRPQ
jgi:hypothetical protein